MNKKVEENLVPEIAPFGATLIWGKKGTGKTLAGLNSPWEPVHVIDTELSSKEYHLHTKKLIELGFLRSEFTRAECLHYDAIQAEIYRIVGINLDKPKERQEGEQYGTIVIDTGGQWSEWVATYEHKKAASQKTGQIVWGRIRDRLRDAILELSGHCKCLILTAHERKYGNDISPRCNPALLEIAAVSIRLQRSANQRLPGGEIVASRVPFFPPRVNDFTLESLLPFFGDPADWNKLDDDQMIIEEPEYVPVVEEEKS